MHILLDEENRWLLRRVAKAVAVLVALPITLQAQATKPDSTRPDSARALAPVIVTRERAVSATGAAAAVVIAVPQLRSSPAPLLDQALREAPFVLVRQNARGEMEISIRGSDSRQASVMYNGVPVSLGWDHRVDPSLIPLTGNDNLTIVRGLGSLLGGPNTLGGTVEITQGQQPVGRRVWAGLGLDQTQARVLSVGGGWGIARDGGGMWSLSAGASNRARDGFVVPGGTRDTTAVDDLRTNSDLHHTDAFASLRWAGPSGRRMALTLSGFRAERGVAPEEHIRSPRLWRYPYSNRAMAAFSASTGSVRTPFGYGSLELGAGINGGRLKIETFSNRSFSTVTATEEGEETTVTGRLLATHSLGAATWRGSYTTASVGYTETLPPVASVQYRQVLWSAASEVEVPLGSRTTLAGGVVFDKSRTPETGGRALQEPFDNGGWRLGVSHQLRTGVRLHANGTTRSRFPALRELYSGALNRFLPNPDLKPETLVGFESGATINGALGANARGTLQVIGFVHEMDDAIVRITLPAPDRRFKRVNRDRIESAGLELLGGLSFGPSARAVTLSADALIQNIEIVDESLVSQVSRRPENNPERRGTLELGVPLGLGIRGAAIARHTGVQYCLNPDTSRELELKGATRQDYSIERSFGLRGSRLFGSIRALLALDNAGDVTIYDQCGLPQPGRTLRVMFSLR